MLAAAPLAELTLGAGTAGGGPVLPLPPPFVRLNARSDLNPNALSASLDAYGTRTSLVSIGVRLNTQAALRATKLTVAIRVQGTSAAIDHTGTSVKLDVN